MNKRNETQECLSLAPVQEKTRKTNIEIPDPKKNAYISTPKDEQKTEQKLGLIRKYLSLLIKIEQLRDKQIERAKDAAAKKSQRIRDLLFRHAFGIFKAYSKPKVLALLQERKTFKFTNGTQISLKKNPESLCITTSEKEVIAELKKHGLSELVHQTEFIDLNELKQNLDKIKHIDGLEIRKTFRFRISAHDSINLIRDIDKK